jgi:hypothetical protein
MQDTRRTTLILKEQHEDRWHLYSKKNLSFRKNQIQKHYVQT